MRRERVLVLGLLGLAGCRGDDATRARPPAPPTTLVAPATAQGVEVQGAEAPAAPVVAPAARAADPVVRAPATVDACTLTPAAGSAIVSLARDRRGGVWSVDDAHDVRRYALAPGAGCALQLDTSSGPEGVVQALGEGAEASSVLADDAGHVYVSSGSTSVRFTDDHRDYACAVRPWAIAADGTRGYGPSNLITFSDTGCESSSWVPPAGFELLVPHVVLPGGELVASSFSSTLSSEQAGNSVVLIVEPDGTARQVLYDGPNVPDHPALEAFACGSRVCMPAGASMLVLDPATMSFEAPLDLATLVGASVSDLGSSTMTPLGDGDALYAFRVWNDAAERAEARLFRIHGLPR